MDGWTLPSTLSSSGEKSRHRHNEALPLYTKCLPIIWMSNLDHEPVHYLREGRRENLTSAAESYIPPSSRTLNYFFSPTKVTTFKANPDIINMQRCAKGSGTVCKGNVLDAGIILFECSLTIIWMAWREKGISNMSIQARLIVEIGDLHITGLNQKWTECHLCPFPSMPFIWPALKLHSLVRFTWFKNPFLLIQPLVPICN